MASLSFDKGFTREEDRELLSLHAPTVVMPKRGKKNAAETERESGKKFKALRRQHSAVESEINSLEHPGLNRCLDVGIQGYLRYVGLGVMSCSLHQIGRRSTGRRWRWRPEGARREIESQVRREQCHWRWGIPGGRQCLAQKPWQIASSPANPVPRRFKNNRFRPDMKQLPMDHPIFHCVFDIKEKPQVPGVDWGIRSEFTGQTYEARRGPGAEQVHYRAIVDDKQRIMVMICHNTDLGDGWEREGENEYYFREFSEKKAYPMGINIVFYAMTH